MKLSRDHFGHAQKTNHICQYNDISKHLTFCNIFIWVLSFQFMHDRKEKKEPESK